MIWLDNLKKLKKASGLSSKQIAEKANLPERTVVRIFSGETPAPKVDSLCDIVLALGGSLDEVFEIFKGSKAVVGGVEIVNLEDEIAHLKHELSEKDREIEYLKREIEHKNELLAVIDYFFKKGK